MNLFPITNQFDFVKLKIYCSFTRIRAICLFSFVIISAVSQDNLISDLVQNKDVINSSFYGHVVISAAAVVESTTGS